MHSSIIAEVYNSISYVYSSISYGNITSEVGEITYLGGFFASQLDTSGWGLSLLEEAEETKTSRSDVFVSASVPLYKMDRSFKLACVSVSLCPSVGDLSYKLIVN